MRVVISPVKRRINTDHFVFLGAFLQRGQTAETSLNEPPSAIRKLIIQLIEPIEVLIKFTSMIRLEGALNYRRQSKIIRLVCPSFMLYLNVSSLKRVVPDHPSYSELCHA